MHRVWIAFFQLTILLCVWPSSGIPSISPAYAQHRRRFTQVIHRFVHRKAWGSCAARQQRISHSAHTPSNDAD